MEHSDLKVATVWTNIDQTPEPRSFIQFLDALNSTGWLQAHKHRTLASLDIHEGVHLLDVGCGTGADARMVAQQVGPTGKVVGVAPSATMITEAQKRTEGLRLPVEFRSGSVYALPLADGTFDGCYSFLTFDILEHPQKALAEIIRVTRSGGQVVLSAPDHGTLIIDAPNRAVTRAILNFWCDSVHSAGSGSSYRDSTKRRGCKT